MAGAVANLMVRAGADFSQLERGMQQAQGSVNSFSSGIRASLGRIGEFAASIGLERIFEKIADGMKEGIKAGIEYNAWVESSTVAWTTLLGSTEKAKKQLQDISTFAAETQFDTEGVNTMAVYLSNAGYAGKDLMDQLQRVADVSGAFNISSANAQEMVRQFAQVDQATVAYTQDLNQLQDKGIPIYKSIASELGVTVAQVRKMASEGKISSQIFDIAFKNIAQSVKGASEAQSKTWNGMMSTFQDDFKILAGALTKPLFDNLKKELTSFMPILDGFVSLTRGDFKSFATSLENAFGKETGQKIVSFTQDVSSGFSKVKDTITGIVDIFKGNQNGEAILTYVGFSLDSIRKLESARDTVIDLFKGKNGLVSSFQEVFGTLKSIAVPMLKDVIDFAKNAFSQLKSFWDQDGKNVTQAIKDEAKLIADIFKNILAPDLQVVWDSVKTVGTVAFNVFIATIKFLGDHMNWVMPILSGVVGAIAAFKIINTIVNLIDIWRSVTVLMTAAQSILNIVLDANPIGATVLVIGLLIAAGVALYRNWDTVSAAMSRIMTEIEQGAASMVNGIIDKIDWLIDKLNAVGNLVGVTIPKISHVDWGAQSGSGGGSSVGDLPSVAHFATGTNFAPGGLSLVGEEGPELVNLPRGSKVHTANETKNMLNGGNKGNTYNVTVNTLKADMNEKDLVRALQRMEALNT